MRRRKQSELDKELADNARLLRAWRRWHKEQLEEALAGMHRDVFERLMTQLKDLRSARELITLIEAQDWTPVDADTRLIALHQINAAITRLRERNGLAPIDDALPHERPTSFLLIRKLFEAAGRHAGHPAKQ